MPAATVVIVDDSATRRAAMQRWLAASDDFTVAGTARDGQDGLRVVGETEPDVVLLDLDMPGLSGTDALPLIRVAHPGATIVVLTALEDLERRWPHLRDLGADALLGVEAGPEVLVIAVRDALARRRGAGAGR